MRHLVRKGRRWEEGTAKAVLRTQVSRVVLRPAPGTQGLCPHVCLLPREMKAPNNVGFQLFFFLFYSNSCALSQ